MEGTRVFVTKLLIDFFNGNEKAPCVFEGDEVLQSVSTFSVQSKAFR